MTAQEHLDASDLQTQLDHVLKKSQTLLPMILTGTWFKMVQL